MEIALLLNDPPGGRCRLYRAYAAALAEHAAARCTERGGGLAEDGLCAPALLIDGRVVSPADGVILSPQDIATALAAADAPRLEAILNEVLDRCMEEWS